MIAKSIIISSKKIILKLNRTRKSARSDDSSSEDEIQKELSDLYRILLPQKKGILEARRKSQFVAAESVEIKDDSQNVQRRQRLLLNLAHLCLIYEDVNLCSRIVGYLKENENLTEEILFEIELIECEQSIKQLKHKQEKFSKNTIRLRIECINKCHETLRNIFRTQNFRLIQLGCLKQWNFCLPLLQPGLRVNVRRPLQFVAECLEAIESMEWLLRCQVHLELAKCDEEIEQLQTAEQHFLKALNFDDENIYKEQLEHGLKRLRLRAELYFPPERIEDQVAMILEQCVIGGKSKQKVLKPAIGELLESLNAKRNETPKEINTRSLLLRAGDLLASEFTHVLESETFKAFGKLNEDHVAILHKKMLNYENCVRKSEEHLQDRMDEFVRNYLRNNPESSSESPEIEQIIKIDYKERLKLWYDLCRIARKQQIWDICRVSCRFCLLYDGEQFVSRFLKSSAKFNSLFDTDLMRNLAEAHFIFAEVIVFSPMTHDFYKGRKKFLNQADKPMSFLLMADALLVFDRQSTLVWLQLQLYVCTCFFFQVFNIVSVHFILLADNLSYGSSLMRLIKIFEYKLSYSYINTVLLSQRSRVKND
ncbi:cilia- and flagella-associated 46-like [Brachionus plicatilis]|uniref:Cilia-and flagella-associated 46-like n=1 Tax=Brachionus plicatilis TaxID=10195 RepID=A0A3M7PW15_BRAPC|nr:cilia- and flagella-associated 46-like [Brachionus plicatilis]